MDTTRLCFITVGELDRLKNYIFIPFSLISHMNWRGKGKKMGLEEEEREEVKDWWHGREWGVEEDR